ncbi:hypothetical protein [Acinetobacter rongchengensis]|uniref:hypothetical protein n=1 Tax=Acinetobacter rongchengensis TaxID=2419601 RepID=UPI00148BE78F|nr:hypothetical protein [Acinetobacter rongchengensis]
MSDKSKPTSSSKPVTDSRPPEITSGPRLQVSQNSYDPTSQREVFTNVKVPSNKK